jgi:hypothetical protein
MLKDKPEPGLFLLASFAAVVVAPVVEEYFFRGLLQGWLESLTRRHSFEHFLLGIRSSDARLAETMLTEVSEVTDFPYASTKPPADILVADVVPTEMNPYVTPAEIPPENPKNISKQNPAMTVPIWPMFVSAAVFALAHFSHGPDWIPLFVLALGLGFLYQRTHRLLPCMTVHFLLNLASMGVLYIEVFLKPVAP